MQSCVTRHAEIGTDIRIKKKVLMRAFDRQNE